MSTALSASQPLGSSTVVGDGLRSPLRVHIYNRDTHIPIAQLTFTPTNAGIPNGGSRFIELQTRLHLEAGFHGVIAVDYVSANNELNGTLRVPPGGWTTESGGGLIGFVGSGRLGYGAGGVLPDLVVSGCLRIALRLASSNLLLPTSLWLLP